MLKPFHCERNQTKHQGQSHFTHTHPCLSPRLVHRGGTRLPELPRPAVQPLPRRGAAAGGTGRGPRHASHGHCPHLAAGFTESCQAMALPLPTHGSQDRKSSIDISLMPPPKLLASEPQTPAGQMGENSPDGVRSSRPCFSNFNVQVNHPVSGSAGLGWGQRLCISNKCPGRLILLVRGPGRKQNPTKCTEQIGMGIRGEANGSSGVISSWFEGWRTFSESWPCHAARCCATVTTQLSIEADNPWF